MATPTRDIFADIAKAKSTKRSNNIQEGRGRAVVSLLKYEDMNDGLTFVAELQIIRSEPSGATDPKTGHPFLPNPPGTTVGWIQKTTKFPKTAPGNIKSFVCTLIGEDEDTIDPDKFAENFRSLVSDDQPGRGIVVDYETYRQATKDQKAAGRGEYNVYPRFRFVEQSGDAVAVRRAILDKGEKVAE